MINKPILFQRGTIIIKNQVRQGESKKRATSCQEFSDLGIEVEDYDIEEIV